MGYSPRSRQRTAHDYGARGDGGSHPLSTVFNSLTAAQACYPNANVTTLTDELDWAALQQLFCDSPGIGVASLMEPGSYVTSKQLVHLGGKLDGYGAIIQPNANMDVAIQFDGAHCDINGLSVNGQRYIGAGWVAQAVAANTHGFSFHDCANSSFRDLYAFNCAGWGFVMNTGSDGMPAGTPGGRLSGRIGIADFCHLYNPKAEGCGILCIQQLTLNNPTATGSFTLTITDKFGQAHTTAAIPIGTPCGGSALYSVSGCPGSGTGNPSTTIEGIVGTALETIVYSPGDPAHNFPVRIHGFGGLNAWSTVLCGNNPTVTSGSGSATLANGPLYLVFQGDLLGPQPLVTVNNAGMTGGAVSVSSYQVGVRGGGLGFENPGGVDSNFNTIWSPRMAGNNGDGLWIASIGNEVWKADVENNSHGAAIRVEPGPNAGGTALQGNVIHQWESEGCFHPLFFDNGTSFVGASYNTVDCIVGGGAPGTFGFAAQNVVCGQPNMTIQYQSLTNGGFPAYS